MVGFGNPREGRDGLLEEGRVGDYRGGNRLKRHAPDEAGAVTD